MLGRGSDGANKLAQVIAERIGNQTERPDALELGSIQDDMSLKIDRFAVPVPKGEYLISDWTAKLSLPAFSLFGVGEYPIGDPITYFTPPYRWDWEPQTVNPVKIEIRSELKPGDRVLVAWVNNGIDPVVMSKVVSS